MKKMKVKKVDEMLKRSKLAELREKNINRKYAKKSLGDYDNPRPTVEFYETDHKAANLVSSQTTDGFHAPVIDLDVPAMLIPSMTRGHHHLYIDKRLTWIQYKKLLDVMVEIGLVERGWVESGEKWESTFVRKSSLEIKALFGADDDDD